MPPDAPVVDEDARLERMNAYQDRMAPTAIRRIGGLEEIARAALFLASDEASYITGVDFPVDGGFLVTGYRAPAAATSAAGATNGGRA